MTNAERRNSLNRIDDKAAGVAVQLVMYIFVSYIQAFCTVRIP